MEKVCRIKYKMSRLAASLRSTWQPAAKEAQHVIAAKWKVKAMNKSGVSDEMIDNLTQEQFHITPAKEGKG